MTVAVVLGDFFALVVLVVAVADLVTLLLVAGVALLLVNGLVDRLIGGLALKTKAIYCNHRVFYEILILTHSK